MVHEFYNLLFILKEFFVTGGWVLLPLFVLCFVLFSLLLERYVYRLYYYPRNKRLCILQAQTQHKVLVRSMHCDLSLSIDKHLTLIKVLITLCPLLGLLGTVSGMVQVFDGVSWYGTGNPRLLASGVASATYPTMIGVAIPALALLFYSRLQSWAFKEKKLIRSIKNQEKL